MKNTTFIPKSIDCISYEVSNTTDCVVGMIKKAKIIINTDSGLAHLCRLLGVKQTVISVIGRGGGVGQMEYFRDKNNPTFLNEVPSTAFEDVDILLKSIDYYYEL